MEINITSLINNEDLEGVTGSRAELGEDAGEITWNRAQDLASDVEVFTPEAIEAARPYFKDFGAWTEEEIQAWTDLEVKALLLQYISSEYKENGLDEGSIYQGDDGQVYFYLGH